MASSDRARDVGALHLVSTFLGSFPPRARPTQERRLASVDRVCADGCLTVRVERDGKELVIRASGELDIASSGRLEEELIQAIDDGGASDVVLDLGGLDFIDAAGLRILLFAAKQSATNGTRLRMIRTSKPVLRAIHVGRVESALPLAD